MKWPWRSVWLNLRISSWIINQGLSYPLPPWKVFKMLIFFLVMIPTMSRNIFRSSEIFLENWNFWVILESLLQLKRIFWLFQIIFNTVHFYVPDELLSELNFEPPPQMSSPPRKSLCQVALIEVLDIYQFQFIVMDTGMKSLFPSQVCWRGTQIKFQIILLWRQRILSLAKR